MPKSVYENKYYKIVIGIPPKTSDFPEPIASYLVVHKEYEVVEYFHSILYYAREHADHFVKLLDGEYDKEKQLAGGVQFSDRSIFN